MSKRRYNRIIIYSSDEDIENIEDSTEVQAAPVAEQITQPTATDALLQDAELIDMELLQTLGDFEPEAVEWGENLFDDLAKRFQHILLNGLKKEAKEDLHKRHLFPKNIPLTKAPTLNPELSAILPDTHKSRDKTISNKQDQLGRALAAMGKAMSALILKTPNLQEVLRNLNDCSQLIADSHYNETYTRRALVIPLVDKSLTDQLKDRKRDNLLFGNDLSEMVKSSRGIKKTGDLMQITPSTSKPSLNWKGPLTRSVPNRNFQTNRASGQRLQQYKGRRCPPGTSLAQRRAFQPPIQTAAPPGRRGASRRRRLRRAKPDRTAAGTDCNIHE